MAPLIGISTGFAAKGAPGAQVNASYLFAVQQAGGVPVLLPPQLSEEASERLFASLDGLLLTGGGDIQPGRYGEEPAGTNVDSVSLERDALEFAAIDAALERDLPILGLCRGAQILNVCFGGSLHQNIPADHPDSAVNHAVPQPREGPAHDVAVEPGSLLHRAVQARAFGVNSRHHQAVKSPGYGMEVVARAPDGVIEGIELVARRFVLGVQWHPEDMAGHFESADRLFTAFVRAAGGWPSVV
jgi:putative glutamine amidotransferase